MSSTRLVRYTEPINIQSGVDLMNSQYAFHFEWTNTDNKFVDFSQSYIDLVVRTSSYVDPDTSHRIPEFIEGWSSYLGTQNKYNNVKWLTPEMFMHEHIDEMNQRANIYSIIDSTEIDMNYVHPSGKEKALKVIDSCIHASRGRKMIALKDLDKDIIEKSMYNESLFAPVKGLNSLRFIRTHPDQDIHIAIPLNLICALGADRDSAVLVQHLKMLFRTSLLTSLVENNKSIPYRFADVTKTSDGWIPAPTKWTYFDVKWFNDFKLISASMTLMTYQNISFQRHELFKSVPSYTQVDYFQEKITDKYLSCICGNIQIFPQTEFPTTKYGYDITNKGHCEDDNEPLSIYRPNIALYNIWADNSVLNTAVKYNEWIKHPIYVIPVNNLANVRSNTGMALIFESKLRANKLILNHIDDSILPDFDSYNPGITEQGNAIVQVNSHPGLQYTYNTSINKNNPYTLHMLCVRSARDI
ncbi:hypothetical protein WA158_008446 [Blastocystis sp. Blastoise]